jgi:Bacterial Ig-like domain (group 2)
MTRTAWSLVVAAVLPFAACKLPTGNGGNHGGNGSGIVAVLVTPPTACLAAGQTIQLVATPQDSAGNPLTGHVVTWTTGNQAVATVDGAGLVQGVGPGSTTITATSEGVTGTAAVALQTNTATANLSSLWALATNFVFAIGDGGTILLYDGTAWSPLCSGTTTALYDMGPARYVVGAGGTILGWVPTQHAWIAQASGTTSDLYGLARTPPGGTLVAVGAGGTIVHLAGTTWIPQQSGTANPLYGVGKVPLVAANFAVGAQGTILFFDGSKWRAEASGTPADLFFVLVNSLSDVYAFGAAGTALHFNGTAWSPLAVGGLSVALRAADVSLDTTGTVVTGYFVVGDGGTILHSANGSTWTQLASGTTTDLAAVGVVTEKDVFAAGAGGTILHYDGVTWQKQR